jgi:alpha-tubulin suppressor-like RCC1 family protein
MSLVLSNLHGFGAALPTRIAFGWSYWSIPITVHNVNVADIENATDLISATLIMETGGLETDTHIIDISNGVLAIHTQTIPDRGNVSLVGTTAQPVLEYAILDAAYNATTFTNGNLTAYGTGYWMGPHSCVANTIRSEGRWYYEVIFSGGYGSAGIVPRKGSIDSALDGAYYTGGSYLNVLAIASGGYSYNGSVVSAFGGPITWDTVGVLFDADNDTLECFIEGVSCGVHPTPAYGSFSPAFTVWTTNWFTVNFGATPFIYPQIVATPNIPRYATFDRNKNSGNTYSGNKLTAYGPVGGQYINHPFRVNMLKSGGKWYFEFTADSGGAGLATAAQSMSDSYTVGWAVNTGGNWNTNIVGILFDADAHTVDLKVNDVFIARLYTTPGVAYGPSFATSTGFASPYTTRANFGATPFTYPQAGYQGWNETVAGRTGFSGWYTLPLPETLSINQFRPTQPLVILTGNVPSVISSGYAITPNTGSSLLYGITGISNDRYISPPPGSLIVAGDISPNAWATFDPLNKSAYINLSNGNLTAKSNGTGWIKSVAGSLFKSTGLLYCEITFTGPTGGIGGYNRSVALASAGVSIDDNSYVGTSSQAWEFFTASDGNGYLYHYGTLYYSGTHGPADGDIISLLWDTTAQTLRVWRNGVGIVTDTSPNHTWFNNVTGSLRVVVTGNGDRVNSTVNFGATPFVYTPPIGYRGWTDVIDLNHFVWPTTGEIVENGVQPVRGRSITPTSGVIIIPGSPVVVDSYTVIPNEAIGSIDGKAPIVDINVIPYYVSPLVGDLVSATDSITLDITHNSGGYPSVGSLSVDGVTPVIAISDILPPDIGTNMLFAWGSNSYGKLGINNSSVSKSIPLHVGTNSWLILAAGQHHSAAIRSDGALFTWGANWAGELGDGTAVNNSSPVQVGTSSWSAISCGQGFTGAIRSDGGLFTWGVNNLGQLGDGTTINKSSPIQIGTSSWTAIACGAYHALGLRTDALVLTWGYNLYGQLGDGTYTNQSSPVQLGGSLKSWKAIAAGMYHSAAIRLSATTNNDRLYCWGANNRGQLGSGVAGNRYTPGGVGVVGTNSWTAVSCGAYHTLGIQPSGALFAWGYGGGGQLGLNNNLDQQLPIQVGTNSWTAVSCGGWFHTVAIKTDSTLFAWGTNAKGQLGDGTTITKSSPIQVGTGNSWTAIAAGTETTFGVRTAI